MFSRQWHVVTHSICPLRITIPCTPLFLKLLFSVINFVIIITLLPCRSLIMILLIFLFLISHNLVDEWAILPGTLVCLELKANSVRGSWFRCCCHLDIVLVRR